MLRKIMTMTFGIGHILHWNDRNLLEFPEDLKRHKDQVYQLYIKNNSIEILVNIFKINYLCLICMNSFAPNIIQTYYNCTKWLK
jgi:hypothetical protein